MCKREATFITFFAVMRRERLTHYLFW